MINILVSSQKARKRRKLAQRRRGAEAGVTKEEKGET
jgi:hypothetical protein